MIRDILAIFGASSLGWTIYSWHHRTDRALTEGMIAAVVCLIIVVYSIKGEQKRREELRIKNDRLKQRNQYLECAIKQMGGDRL